MARGGGLRHVPALRGASCGDVSGGIGRGICDILDDGRLAPERRRELVEVSAALSQSTDTKVGAVLT